MDRERSKRDFANPPEPFGSTVFRMMNEAPSPRSNATTLLRASGPHVARPYTFSLCSSSFLPHPDFRYRSRFSAVFRSGCSSNKTLSQGLPVLVERTRPALWDSKRLSGDALLPI